MLKTIFDMFTDFKYVLLRVIRKLIPDNISQFLLHRNIILKPGFETFCPQYSLNLYTEELNKYGKTFKNSIVVDFGYGGYFCNAALFLTEGARHVYLIDKYAKPDHNKNIMLVKDYSQYFHAEGQQCIPDPKYITVIDDDIIDCCDDIKADIVLSSSVFEHIFTEELERVIHSLMKITNPDGINIHFIDIRDHYFKYPFHMLCYSEKTWKRFLNPKGNLNRLRLPDYNKAFSKYFENIGYNIERNKEELNKIKYKIKKDFLTGNDETDSVMTFIISALNPKE